MDKKEYADDDEVLQAQYKLSGLCLHCGADPKTESRSGSFAKHNGLCMGCFVHETVHRKNK